MGIETFSNLSALSPATDTSHRWMAKSVVRRVSKSILARDIRGVAFGPQARCGTEP